MRCARVHESEGQQHRLQLLIPSPVKANDPAA